MKTYGQKRTYNDSEATNMDGWKGSQSRKVARRRAKTKKLLHRRARRTNQIPNE